MGDQQPFEKIVGISRHFQENSTKRYCSLLILLGFLRFGQRFKGILGNRRIILGFCPVKFSVRRFVRSKILGKSSREDLIGKSSRPDFVRSAICSVSTRGSSGRNSNSRY